MKTLDEVIKALELCTGDYDCVGYECPYRQEGTCCDIVAVPKMQADALHYLKTFRDAKDALDTERDRYAEAVKNCEKAENKYRILEDELNVIRREHIKQMKNDPLT